MITLNALVNGIRISKDVNRKWKSDGLKSPSNNDYKRQRSVEKIFLIALSLKKKKQQHFSSQKLVLAELQSVQSLSNVL